MKPHRKRPNPTIPFEFRRGYDRLVRAVVGMGDWIAAQPKATDKDREAVRRIQDAFRMLPAPPRVEFARYAVWVHPPLDRDPHPSYPVRGWSARIQTFSSSEQQFAVSSCYGAGLDPVEEDAHEVHFEIPAGQFEPYRREYFEPWIRETRQLEVYLRRPGARLNLDIEFDPGGIDGVFKGKHRRWDNPWAPRRRRAR